MARICRGRSTGCFKWSAKKHCVAKVLLAIWEIFLHENNRNYNSYRCSYKFAFILFLFFLTSQKQESRFQQVAGLVTRNISVFCLYQLALYFKAMSNSMDFYKGIFLHVIPRFTQGLLQLLFTFFGSKTCKWGIMYYNCSFLIQKSFIKLSSLLHNLTYLSLFNSFLFLNTFSVFLKILNNYFFRILA